MKECPKCKNLTMHDEEVLNSLSRRDNKTYICNDCGNEEALIDLGEMEPDENDREFVKTHKPSPKKEAT